MVSHHHGLPPAFDRARANTHWGNKLLSSGLDQPPCGGGDRRRGCGRGGLSGKVLLGVSDAREGCERKPDD